ncbi:MAG: radical SAM protein [Victivallales bacterium]|nr:radical SAM protein [Victivallales bacterium]
METKGTVDGQSSFLRVARRKRDCRVLGPGKRAVVWFHGCSRGCRGCIAVEMNHSNDYKSMMARELYDWVVDCENIEGVTLSGGEPLEQDTAALCEFLRLVREDKRDLGVILFTGYRLNELEKNGKNDIIQYIDVLVDGPYVDELNDGFGLCGSSNQRIHFLTSRYEGMQDIFFGSGGRNLEFDVDMYNNVIINGIPARGFLEGFTQKIHEQGYGISFEDRKKES